jgi:hypothetical protein
MWKKLNRRYPQQAVILMSLKSGGLHEKQAVATPEFGNHLSICFKTEKPRKPVSRWPVAGPSGCILTTSQQSGKQKLKKKSPVFEVEARLNII